MSKSEPERPPIDNPIESSAEDVLGRAPVAHDFAGSIRELDASKGMVVAVIWIDGSAGRCGQGAESAECREHDVRPSALVGQVQDRPQRGLQ